MGGGLLYDTGESTVNITKCFSTAYGNDTSDDKAVLPRLRNYVDFNVERFYRYDQNQPCRNIYTPYGKAKRTLWSKAENILEEKKRHLFSIDQFFTFLAKNMFDLLP